jgi:hypothetical protein
MKSNNPKNKYVKKSFLRHFQAFLGCKFFRKKNIFFLIKSGPQVTKIFFSTKNYFISNHLLRMPKRLHRCPNPIITSRTRDTDLHFVTQLNRPHPMKSNNSKINSAKKSFLRHLQAFLGYKFFRKKIFFMTKLGPQVTKIFFFYKKLFHL